MDKFTLHTVAKSEGFKILNVDSSTHDKLSQLKDDTGVSLTKIVAQMVDFCLERLEIKED